MSKQDSVVIVAGARTPMGGLWAACPASAPPTWAPLPLPKPLSAPVLMLPMCRK